jgi:hypothetical protein
MTLQHAVVIIPTILIILFAGSICQALVDTKLIEEVHNKAVLDARDLKVIDDFVAVAVQDLVRTVDFTAIAKTRSIILSKQGTQAQYVQKFSESAYRHISEGFQYAGALPEDRRFIVVTNLLILIDGLKDPALIELVLRKLDDKNQAVRYWAVRAVTNTGMLERLSKAAPPGPSAAVVIGQIISRLTGLVETSSPETLALIADFAARVDSAGAEQLLLKVADVRIKSYADWTVSYELVDSAILRVLCDKAVSAGSSKADLARRFAQLYSYAIQRYIDGRDLLSDTPKQQLASVIVETEKQCIGKLLGGEPWFSIRRAVEGNDFSELRKEHDKLLGSASTAGALVSKLRFDYGQEPNGSIRTWPAILPPAPKQPAKTVP